MNKAIKGILIILTGLMILLYLRRFSYEKTNVDHLDMLIKKTRVIDSISKYVYFFSSSNSLELFDKAQLVLAPKIVSQKKIEDIPAKSWILCVQDKTLNSVYPFADSLALVAKTAYIEEEELYKIIFFKK